MRLRDLARGFAALDGGDERGVGATVCLLAPWIPLLMRLPLAWVSRVVPSARTRRGRGRAIAPERIAEIVDFIQASAHPLVRRGCLTRGVSLLWLLRRSGIAVELAFGIGGPADGDQGHCWLVYEGQPYLERKPFGDRFVEVWRIPAPVIP